MRRDYPRLSLEDFGTALLRTGDLDPLYPTILAPGMGEGQLRRWMIAYWCFYSSGGAAWASELWGSEFWDTLDEWARNETPCPAGGRWPRGRERRHFRGRASVSAVAELRRRFPEPEDACRSLEAPQTLAELKARVVEWPQFGPWIAFKIGDLLERISGIPIDFTEGDLLFFDSPREAADAWCYRTGKEERGADAIRVSCSFLQWFFRDRFLAPPRFDRPLGIQKYETILCKWGSHNHGHYPVGIDTRELVEGLEPWSRISPTAKGMLLFAEGIQ